MLQHLTIDFVIFDLQKVLILTTNDVDSLATVKILLQLFRVDSVYTVVVPVEDYTKLRDAYVPYADNVSNNELYLEFKCPV